MLTPNFRHFEKVNARGVLLALCLLCSFPIFASAPQNPERFATPDDAFRAVVQAAEANNTATLLRIFGSAGKDVVETGNPEEDKAMRLQFARLSHEETDIHTNDENPGRADITIGAQAWPFPIPLVRVKGRWQFDIAQGRAAILAHRIGENELDVIDVCRGFVEAEFDYSAETYDGTDVLGYAQEIRSSRATRDGLFWEDEIPSLVPKAFAEAAVSGTDKPTAPYHGYYFRVITAQGPHARGGAVDYVVNGKMIGGFALIAWPAQYGVSGIKAFIVNHDGIVYEKDLGADTARLVVGISTFDPDDSWRQVVD